jgi:hypothetical protein
MNDGQYLFCNIGTVDGMIMQINFKSDGQQFHQTIKTNNDLSPQIIEH